MISLANRFPRSCCEILRKCLPVIGWKICLDFSYYFYVAPEFEALGFANNFILFKYVLGWFLVFSFAVMLPKMRYLPSHLFLDLILLFKLTPIVTYFSFNDISYYHFMLLCFSCFLIAIVSLGIKPFRGISFPFSISPRAIILLLILSCVAVVVTYVISYDFVNFNMSKIYSMREALRGTTPRWASYMIMTFSKAIIPVSLALSFLNKKYYSAMAFVGFQVLFFGATSNKTFLFSIPVILFIVMFDVRRRDILFVVLMLLICSLLFLKDYFPHLPSWFIRRTFFTPAFLDFEYYRFFSENENIFLSNSIFRNYISYPYTLSYPKLVAASAGKYGGFANNSFFSTSYMHWAEFGVVTYSFAVGLLFVLSDSLYSIYKKNVEPLALTFVSASLFYPFFSLITSVDLTTVFLTHGLFVSFLAVFTFSRFDFWGGARES